MRYQSSLAFLFVLSWQPLVYGSVSEVEPNSKVTGSAIFQTSDPLVRIVREVDNTGEFNDTANQDPSLAVPLSLTDELVGQLSGPRDYDWFYVDIADSNQPVTPIYFGCDKKLGYYYESLETFTIDEEKDLAWRINYYYDDNPATPGGVSLVSSYLVYKESCKRGLSETKGPLRFQMNTQRPGRYYVRIWGNLLASGLVLEDRIEIGGEEKTRKTYYDRIVNSTADYTLRLYTARVGGELEPNDGMVEAYALSSGTTVSAQLSSMYDQDWFYIDNDSSKNTTKKLPFYFNCKGQTGSTYILSAYNQLGVLQSNYEVKAEQCNGSSGFSFTIDAPVSARYFFVVSSPTYTENAQFTQADYSVLVISGNQATAPVDTPSRREGDLEPNEKSIDAFPVPKNVGITGQISSNTDLDWYVVDYTADQTTTGITSVTFDCKGQTNSQAAWELAAYNPQNVPQASYTITTAQCIAAGGFKFSLNTPTSGKYLILVNAKADPTGAAFSQSDYTLRWNPVTTDGSGGFGSGTVTRLLGELEPNDTPINAFPLTNDAVVTAQLASLDDLDFYYFDQGETQNSSSIVPIYFGCNVAGDSAAKFMLSYYNSLGVLQKSYDVGAAQCSNHIATGTTTPAVGAFRFEMKTPTAGRYYVLVAGPADKDLASFSDADYTLSTFLDIASQISPTNTGNLRTASIVDNAIANRDSFTINLNRCGPKGTVRLAGNKLNLVGVDANSQVLVQIGQWSCLSSAKQLFDTSSSAARKSYAFPKPAVPAAPTPTKPKIVGGGG